MMMLLVMMMMMMILLTMMLLLVYDVVSDDVIGYAVSDDNFVDGDDDVVNEDIVSIVSC